MINTEVFVALASATSMFAYQIHELLRKYATTALSRPLDNNPKNA
jgi:hypothetical protein